MKIVDDRTEDQRKTHRFAVMATDKFMSGWGHASGGSSVCGWACAPDVNTDRMWNWVKSRREMRRVRVVCLDNYRPKGNVAHCHIYVANEDHPGNQSRRQARKLRRHREMVP